MNLRATFATCTLLAACHTPPAAPLPTSSAAHDALVAELRALRQDLQQRATLDTEWLARLATTAPAESPATTELCARLAALVERLDDRPAAPARPIDAAHGVRDAGNVPKPDPAVLLAALTVLERTRRVLHENLANTHTPGYQRRQVELTTRTDANGTCLPAIAAITTQPTMGSIAHTERRMDLAIVGDGYFGVQAPNGHTWYSRAGALHVDAQWQLCIGEHPLVPTVVLPFDSLDVFIDDDGRVCVRTAGSPDTCHEVGRIALYRCLDHATLRPEQGNLLRPDETCFPREGWPGTVGLGQLKQGCLEQSNVDASTELVNLQACERDITIVRRSLASLGVFTR
jgi:flagellar basal-body rod protein FlgG